MNRSEIVLAKHKGKIALVLAVLLFGFLCVPIARAAEKVPRAVLRSADSVVRVVATSSREISSGTGFVIKNGRDASYVATNHHVVEGTTESVGVYLDQDTFIEAQIVADSAQSDCCILKTSERLPMRALTLTTRASRGDAIYAVGFPGAADDLSLSVATLAREATITDGIISAVRAIQVTASGKDVTMYQINADINPGNSGGPLFDVKGRVIGMNTYGWVGGSGINGAIAIEETIALAKENGVKVKTGGTAFFIAAACAIIAALLLAAVVVGTMVIGKRRKLKKAEKRENTPLFENPMETLGEKVKAPPMKKERRKMRRGGKIALCAVCAIAAMAAVYVGTYFAAVKLSENGEFKTAQNLIFAPFVTNLHDPQFTAYLTAGC